MIIRDIFSPDPPKFTYCSSINVFCVDSSLKALVSAGWCDWCPTRTFVKDSKPKVPSPGDRTLFTAWGSSRGWGSIVDNPVQVHVCKVFDKPLVGDQAAGNPATASFTVEERPFLKSNICSGKRSPTAPRSTCCRTTASSAARCPPARAARSTPPSDRAAP